MGGEGNTIIFGASAPSRGSKISVSLTASNIQSEIT